MNESAKLSSLGFSIDTSNFMNDATSFASLNSNFKICQIQVFVCSQDSRCPHTCETCNLSVVYVEYYLDAYIPKMLLKIVDRNQYT
jgi:hypothetical protein